MWFDLLQKIPKWNAGYLSHHQWLPWSYLRSRNLKAPRATCPHEAVLFRTIPSPTSVKWSRGLTHTLHEQWKRKQRGEWCGSMLRGSDRREQSAWHGGGSSNSICFTSYLCLLHAYTLEKVETCKCSSSVDYQRKNIAIYKTILHFWQTATRAINLGPHTLCSVYCFLNDESLCILKAAVIINITASND
jgi:hypothetical protein